MSADLLAEFGQAPDPANYSSSQQQPAKWQKSSFFDDLNQENDIFGSSGSLQHDEPSHAPLGGRSQSATPKTQWQAFEQQNFDLPQHQNSEVLFDAAFDAPASDAEDDWGEFEGPESNNQHATLSTEPQQSATASFRSQPNQKGSPALGTIDLLDSLSLHDSAPVVKQPSKITGKQYTHESSKPQTQATWDDDSFGDWGDFTDAPISQAHPSSEKKAIPSPKPHSKVSTNPKPPASTWDHDTFEDWGDFTEEPSTNPDSKPKPKPAVAGPSPISFVSGTTAPAANVRPTNIPPPSVLLELFLDVFENLHKEATLAKSHLRSASPSTDVSITASNIYNALLSAARVIAGRSLRWKRDTILSQSMRIGPARSGKVGGMKLNSVNKQENIKEEQDAVDVLVAWRERAVVFNAILQGVGQRPIPTVPDPSALKVIIARADQGALKASHPCALCSLKRDERVLRVDEQNVQDSFGEWWTEHWGHTPCRQFWEANRYLLGQR
jgi:hypothetical protein